MRGMRVRLLRRNGRLRTPICKNAGDCVVSSRKDRPSLTQRRSHRSSGGAYAVRPCLHLSLLHHGCQGPAGSSSRSNSRPPLRAEGFAPPRHLRPPACSKPQPTPQPPQHLHRRRRRHRHPQEHPSIHPPRTPTWILSSRATGSVLAGELEVKLETATVDLDWLRGDTYINLDGEGKKGQEGRTDVIQAWWEQIRSLVADRDSSGRGVAGLKPGAVFPHSESPTS
ncbi:hypothetical protein DFP72DRAFT_905050, partial [Ephemerocybe angulata]